MLKQIHKLNTALNWDNDRVKLLLIDCKIEYNLYVPQLYACMLNII